MRLGTEVTIHGNVISFLVGAGFILVIKGSTIIGSVLLLASGIYGNIVARRISKKIMTILFPFLHQSK